MAASSVRVKASAAVSATIAQILSCKDRQFRIYDIPIQTVSLVGVIRDMTITSYEVICTLEDHTGGIKGVMRLETESEVVARTSGIKVNKYAQVFGTLRVENGQKILLMLKMFPVNDLNVVTHHYLEVCCFTLEAEDEWKKQLASASTSGAALADALTTNEEITSSTLTKPTFNDLQKLVFDIVKSEYSDEGITRGNILRQFPSYQGHEVNQALDYLINEGLIYYTVDQEHLRAAVRY